MEKEEKKLETEDKIALIDDLIKDEQEAIDEYNKAIEKIKGNCAPYVLETLGRIYQEEVSHISTLESIKKKIQNYGLGDTYADEVFGLNHW